MEPSIKIGERLIGAGAPVYIVAEMSANHNGDYGRALRIIEAAAAAGADAIKLQTYTPDTLTLRCDNDYFRIKKTIWQGKTLHELYGEAFTPWEWHAGLEQHARELGLHCFSTPFDATAVDFLEELRMPLHKVASFELVDLALLEKIGATGKPVIMSTGMATLAEIDEAVRTLRASGCRQLALLRCVSAYPAPPAEMHLRTIAHLASAFDVVSGLSDHTPGFAVAVAAVALGAAIVEKHLTLAREDGGPDSAFSMEPDEFGEMVRSIRQVEEALGRVNYEPTAREEESRLFRRSLFVVRDMRRGELFSHENVRSIRPGHGLHPRYLGQVIGARAQQDIVRGTPLAWEHLL